MSRSDRLVNCADFSIVIILNGWPWCIQWMLYTMRYTMRAAVSPLRCDNTIAELGREGDGNRGWKGGTSRPGADKLQQ